MKRYYREYRCRRCNNIFINYKKEYISKAEVLGIRSPRQKEPMLGFYASQEELDKYTDHVCPIKGEELKPNQTRYYMLELVNYIEEEIEDESEDNNNEIRNGTINSRD